MNDNDSNADLDLNLDDEFDLGPDDSTNTPAENDSESVTDLSNASTAASDDDSIELDELMSLIHI